MSSVQARRSDGATSALLREEYAHWLLEPVRGISVKEWAANHDLSYGVVRNWNQDPLVVSIIAARREELRTDFTRVMANMLNIALGQGRAAVPAAKLLADVLGETAPTKIDIAERAPFISLQEKMVAIQQAHSAAKTN